jgi:hypothetical protein
MKRKGGSVKVRVKIRGERGPDIDVFPRNDEPGGVEKKTLQAPFPPVFFIEGKISVFVVPQYGVPQAGEMTPDLVHTPRTQFQFQEGIVRLPRRAFRGGGKDPVEGKRRPGLPPDFQTLGYGSRRGMGKAGGDREVYFLRGGFFGGRVRRLPPPRPPDGAGFPAGEPEGKPGGGFPVLGREDNPRGIPVEPVNQEGPFPERFRQQGIQGYPYALTPLDRQARGLIEDKAIVIFKEDIYILSNLHAVWNPGFRLYSES